ncbi:MAG: malonic semialdehyde reductase [Steroidobacteraceae bacterium]
MYELAKLAPTSANGQPGRFVFLTSPESKQRLRPALSSGNLAKTMQAPVTVIVAYDTRFFENLPQLWPKAVCALVVRGQPQLIFETAFRSAALQGAYLMLAARALGLDCGPMSGFDEQKVNAEFFADGRWRAHFLCNLGYGDRTSLSPRAPRLDFEQACVVL